MGKTFWTIAQYRKYDGGIKRYATKHESYEEALESANKIQKNSQLLFVEVNNGNHTKVDRIYTK